MDKPLVIEIDETKRDLVSVVDAATQIRKIPCYLLEMILSDVLSQVQEVARREREFAKQSLEKQLTEAQTTPKNEDNTEVKTYGNIQHVGKKCEKISAESC